MFTRSLSAPFRAIALVGLLAAPACSSDSKTSAAPPNSGSPAAASTPSPLGGGDSGVIFNSSGSKSTSSVSGAPAGMGVNAFLWRGALDTIGFMPLVSADPFGGVIITDWYTPPGTTGERFKASVYVLGRDLRSDGVRLNINRQVLENGQWVDAAVSPSTVAEIENKMLARARRMREQQLTGG